MYTCYCVLNFSQWDGENARNKRFRRDEGSFLCSSRPVRAKQSTVVVQLFHRDKQTEEGLVAI